MGFRKSKAFEQIRVPMIVNTFNEEDQLVEAVEVVHVFRIPDPDARTEWERRLVQVKGKKIKHGSRSDANWKLWLSSVISVEGYDDLPKGERWKEYFTDPIGRIHVDSAIAQLMDFLGSEEVEQEKKSEPSSELSYSETRELVPTSEMKST